ncbi:MAG: hypothetical protein ACRDPR_12445 [Nocardioidaceae bacterium]
MEPDNATPSAAVGRRWGWRHLWSLLGFVLLVWWFPFYAYVSLVAPEWTVIPSLLVWLACLGLVIRWFRSHPVRTFLVGLGAIALWSLAAFFFDAVLGWTA